tara:strand:- start:97 stop:357 length:261 start_codon:yes stop_codon:yes gene_type:complete
MRASATPRDGMKRSCSELGFGFLRSLLASWPRDDSTPESAELDPDDILGLLANREQLLAPLRVEVQRTLNKGRKIRHYYSVLLLQF